MRNFIFFEGKHNADFLWLFLPQNRSHWERKIKLKGSFVGSTLSSPFFLFFSLFLGSGEARIHLNFWNVWRSLVERKLATDCWVPMVFNRIVSPSWEVFGNQGPFIAESRFKENLLFMVFDYEAIFILCPLEFFNIRIQVVVPSLPALFSYPAFHASGDSTPVFSAIVLNQFHQ